MENNLKKKTISIYVLFATIFLLLLLKLSPYGEKIKDKLYDNKLIVCSHFRSDPYGIEKKIVTIAIDDLQTVPQIGYPTYYYHIKMVEKLNKFKVNTILYDLVFKGDIPTELVSMINKNGNVYIPVIFELFKDKKYSYKISQYPKDEIDAIKSGDIPSKNDLEFLWNSGFGVFPNLDIIKAAKGIGHISTGNEEFDKNNIFRKTALLINVGGNYFPNISLIVACDFFHVQKENIKIEPGEYLILPNARFPDGTCKDIKIPINERCEMLVNFIKPWKINKHEFLEPFWFVSVLNLQNDPDTEKELHERLKGKICIIGNASSINKDTHNVPIDNNYPGIGIHSQILYTILSNNFIKEISPVNALLISIFFILVLFYLADKIKASKLFILSVILIPLYLILSYVYFALSKISFDDFLPVSGLFLFGFINFVVEYVINEREIANFKKQILVLDAELNDKLVLLTNSQDELIKLKSFVQQKSDEKIIDEKKMKELEKNILLNKEKINEIEKERDALKLKVDFLNDKIIESDFVYSKKLDKEDQELIKECAEFGIITQNTNMLELFKIAKKIAQKDHPVLILGDSGTGKELFARAIHKMSLRKNNPLVTINIPAIPDTLLESELFGYSKGAFTGANNDKKGKFEIADKGSVFLDEIGEMKLELQAKILRVLQEKTIDKIGAGKASSVKLDVRLIAATNKDLSEEVKNNRFREELFYRINVFTLKIPALKDRKDDIPYLVEYIISNIKNTNKKISKKAIEKLMNYSYDRNNIRELENIIIKTIELSEKNIIQAEDIELPDANAAIENSTGKEIYGFMDINKDIELNNEKEIHGFMNIEDETFWNILEKNDFNISVISEKLSISRTKVGAMLKGISLKKLSENKWNFELTADKLTNDSNKKKFLIQRFAEYYENINKIVNEVSGNKKIALEESIKRFKNLNKKYHKYVEEAINRIIQNKEIKNKEIN